MTTLQPTPSIGPDPARSSAHVHVALGEYLTARLRAVAEEFQGRSSPSADLALLARLHCSAVSDGIPVSLIDRQRHRLMFDVAERRGWNFNADFLPEWQLPTAWEELNRDPRR